MYLNKEIPSENKPIKAGTWFLILIVCLFTFFINNGSLLPEIMESRNIITAREMVYDGNWMVPTMNGELRLEKPPLPTWATALAEMISPDNLAAERGMAGLAAVLLVIAFFLIGREFFSNERTALVSSMILTTCYSVIIMGRTASWDIYTHGFMMMGIYFLIRGLKAQKSKGWGSFITAGVFIGLSIMSKGPVSPYVLLLPFIIAYCWFYPTKMKGKWGPFWIMVLLALIIGCWWYAFIFIFHHDAMAAVAAKESAAWANHNVRPWYYYWKFFLESGIWSLLLITAILSPLWSWRERERREFLFPLIWMLLTLIFLSIMPEKKSRWLFPVMIPASYAMGYLIKAWDERLAKGKTTAPDRIMFKINASLIALVILILPIALYYGAYSPGYISLGILIAMSVICLFLFLFLAIGIKHCRPTAMVIAVLVLFMSAECLALPSLKHIFNNPDMHSIELTRDIPELANLRFYHNKNEELRIEEVYATHKIIAPLDFENIDALKEAIPCAILTHKSIEEELPTDFLQNADVTFIDRYDNNNHKKGTRFYRDIFIYNVYIVKQKNN